MKGITFAVIGSGFMGSILAKTASELPYVQCVGAADIILSRAQSLTEQIGGRAYENFHEMLEKENPQAVFVATPEAIHREPAVAAAEHSAHVFLEKPMATSLADADAITKACDEAHVKLMIGYILRFEVSYAMIQSAIVEGSIGKFMSAYARRMATISEARRLNGRVSPLTYIGVHDIDQILWYHPVPVKSVYARAIKGRVWEELGTFDSAWLMMEFEDDTLGVHEVGWTLPEEWAKWQSPVSWGGFGDVRMNVTGTHGNLFLDFTPMNLYGVNREGWKLPDTRHWPVLGDKIAGSVKLEVEHFMDCVQHDKSPRVTGEDGRHSLEVMLAAEKSIAEGQKISLPL
jgi:UDP-N-acetylglucosamine 3-dehydrogenase